MITSIYPIKKEAICSDRINLSLCVGVTQRLAARAVKLACNVIAEPNPIKHPYRHAMAIRA